ncbi:DUF2651 family protein [Halobacillus sp. KCTC 3957]|uniref:DUF2651 family protein n=2 Tax=Halobacillus yeomjeoni TaxID=311194 RepID=A0A931MUV5_9BACI|nr:DUF2651 family protein [Halobacillus yeomjeoni]
MDVLPYILFLFPISSFVTGVIIYAFVRKKYIAPILIFSLFLIIQFTFFNYTFFQMVCIYTFLAFSGSFTAEIVMKKYDPGKRLKKVLGIVMAGGVLALCAVMLLSKPYQSWVMEHKVKAHLKEMAYDESEIESIDTTYEHKRNTSRTKPVIAEVVFINDPEHTYRYIELRQKNKIKQMCEYKSGNVMKSEYTEERPHMIKNCY